MPRTYSPLRYPGGKTQLSKFLMKLFEYNNLENIVYAEPFSGGFGAGLELLFANKISKAIINDYDTAIYSIWYAILNETDRFIRDILTTEITIDEWQSQKGIYESLKESRGYSYELAFATYFLNRTNVSGIITGGPIGGLNQKGKYKLDCRFNKENLAEKLTDISKWKDKIELYNLESNEFIEKVLLKYLPEEIFIFFDPPYYEQGKNLYTNFFEHEDHVDLKQKINELKDYNWILTYDFHKEIAEIYNDYNQYLYEINYSANKVRKSNELLIHSDNIKVKNFDKVNLRNPFSTN